MRTLTIATAALLVVLAGYGIANASTLTLTIELGTNQLSLDGLNGPTETTYTVYGVVSNNTTTDFGPPDGFNLNGGIASVMIDQYYSGDGQIRHKQGLPNIATNYTPSLTIPNANFTTKASGYVVNAARVKTWRGTGGVDNTYMAQPGPESAWDYYTDPTRFELGNGTPIVLYTGSIQAVADGDVTIDVVREAGTCLVWKIGEGGLYAAVVDEVVGGQAVVHVGSTAVTPTVTITTPNVGEGGWTQEPGWNNPVHTVSIAADTTDATSFVWWLTNPDTGHAAIVGNSEDLVLTMGDILASAIGGEVPLAGGIAGVTYDWDLTLSVNEGAASDSITVFVPEPATMGLLAFGVVGLLKRRRA